MASIYYLPDTMQFSDYDCGITCVQIILAYYGEDVEKVKLLSKIKHSKKDGTRTEQIIKFLRSRGYKTFAGSMTLDELKKYINKKIPVILFIQAWAEKEVDYTKTQEYGHYVIVRGYNSRGVIIEDPAIFGKGFLSYKELLKRWHGEDTDYLVHFGIAVWGKKPYNFKKLVNIK